MTEHGPYQLNQAGNMLIENPYSWNQQANIIYLEQPYGVRTVGVSLIVISYDEMVTMKRTMNLS